ncbi:MAG: abortive infection family protein [Prevotella sp.]|nr:abortive infection family protein [Prevotella sp.]
MTNIEKGALLKLFIRSGYVLDFSTADFDAFTMHSVGVALCQKYQLSKGKSLTAFIDEASVDDSYKLLSDLLTYYETQYGQFESETHESDLFGTASGSYRRLYLSCKDIIEKYRKSDPNVVIAKAVEESFSTVYMSQQIKLMLDCQESYPAEAIGKAKELIESCCRTILKNRGKEIDENWKFQQLVGRVFDELDVKPDKVDEKDIIAGSLKRIYGSLKGIVQPIAEIRNAFGTGHGRTADFTGLDSRHAKLLVGMSTTLVQFLWSTHEEKPLVNSDPLF